MDFYPAKNNDRLNTRTFHPEAIAGRVMVNPRYPIRQLARVAPWWCARCATFHTFPRVRCDSGAFQDVGKRRMEPRQALEAQLRMEERLRWYLDDHDFHFETIFIYDDPAGVDEAVVDGRKIKVRGTEESAIGAVQGTLEAARYYATQRHRIRGRVGWVGQGINAAQYASCVVAMLAFMRPDDVFAFGGFCIWGRMPAQITPLAHGTLRRVIPLVRDVAGIRDFHLLGVMYAPGVTWAARAATMLGVSLATDGSGPEQAACISGAVYRADGTQDHGVYTKEQKYKEYHPCDLALKNISTYTAWAAGL